MAVGEDWSETKIVVTLKEGMKEAGYSLPKNVVLGKDTSGSSNYTWSDDYTFVLNEDSIEITLTKAGITAAESAKAIIFSVPSRLPDSVSVSTTGTNANNFTVGPFSLKMGAKFSDGAQITVTPKTAGIAFPSSVAVEMGALVGDAETRLVADTDYTYDKTTGVITLMGDKQITGDITVDPADYDFTIVDYKVDKKTGAVENGTGAAGAYTAATGNNVQYMVIDPKDDETLFGQIEEIVAGWLGSHKFPFTDISTGGNFDFTTTAPTLTSEDNGSYLLVIKVDQNSKVAIVGGTVLEGIEAPVASEEFELVAGDTPLTGKLTGNVVTLTVTDEEYTLPTAITSVAIDNNPLTADTEYVYDAVAGTITLNTNKEGKVTVTASATQYIDMIDTTKVTFGKDSNSGKISIDGAELENTDKIIYLNTTVGVEALLKTFKKDMEIDDVQDALGIENSAVSSNVVAGDTAIISPEAESNAGPEYLLIIKLNDSKLVSAGVIKNTSDKTA